MLRGKKEVNVPDKFGENFFEHTFPEKGFNLNLLTRVEGQDLEGNVFNEKNVLIIYQSSRIVVLVEDTHIHRARS